MDVEVLFQSEKAYRVATALRICAYTMTEVLVSDIARSAKVPYATTLYWINIFEICGFIGTTRYAYRENALCRHTRQIIVHLWESKLSRLYNYMWIQAWEENLMQDLKIPNLQLMGKIEKKAA